jgi:splicing factor U2AF subunit
MPQPMPGVFPGMFPFGGAQFGGLASMPAQAMTQQATRHARRVYVGGLPPVANEQVGHLTINSLAVRRVGNLLVE